MDLGLIVVLWDILSQMRNAFSRQRTFLWFVVAVMCFCMPIILYHVNSEALKVCREPCSIMLPEAFTFFSQSSH